MIIPITDKHREWASKRKQFENGRTLKSSGDHRGREVGILGEFALCKALQMNGIPYTSCGSTIFSCDIIVGDIRIDAKTKERKYSYIDRPERIGKDEAHVKNDQKDFDCHIYVFLCASAPSNSDGIESVQIIGWCYKKYYWEESYSVRAGEKDGNYTEQADAGKLLYARLSPVESLYDLLHEHMTRMAMDSESA